MKDEGGGKGCGDGENEAYGVRGRSVGIKIT